jgi:hypothetical protein
VDPLLKEILDPDGGRAALSRMSPDVRLEVMRLRAAVAVMAEALLASGAIDSQRALERVREILQSPDEATAVARGPVPTPAQPTPINAPPETTFECQRCKKVVPARTSYVTSQGTLCDACYRRPAGSPL